MSGGNVGHRAGSIEPDDRDVTRQVDGPADEDAVGYAAQPPRISRRHVLRGAAAAAVSPIALRSTLASAVTGPLPDLALATVQNGLLATVRATGAARIRIRVWPKADPSAAIASAWALTNAANAATIAIPGAAADGRAWSWVGDVQNQQATSAIVTTSTRTVAARAISGPTAFTFAFGCCMHQRDAIPALQVARSASPLFFANIGDMGYRDSPEAYPNLQNYAGYVDLFRKLLRNPDFVPLLAQTPFYGMQDDHDYGKDGCDRFTVKSYAAQAYADLVPGARWPGDAYRRWSIGDVDFFLTDNRRHKDPRGGPYENGLWMSVLGTTQRNWLLNGLAASKAPVKFVFIPMTMIFYWSKGERAAVRRFIADRVSGRVIFLSGDKHASAFARWPEGTWEMLAGPLQNPVKHYTPSAFGVIWTENGTGRALYNCIGLVDVDTVNKRTVTLRLLRENGVELHREVVPV